MAKSKIITGLKQAVRHARERNMNAKMRPSDGAKLVEMTRASGYVMARIPHCMPFVISAGEFDEMPDWTAEGQARRDYWENTMREIASRPVRG